MTKIEHESDLASEVDALINYIQHLYYMRNVMKQRKQWDDDRQAKVSAAIAGAMKHWDETHYPRLLAATWGWHPFYPAFLANPLCSNFRPEYPLYNSVVEGTDVHSMLLQQCHVERVHPVPWSVLMLRCFLKYHRPVPPLISHPFSGATTSNVTGWLKLAEDMEGEGWRAWHLATNYLKEEGFLVFAGARQVESKHEWVDEFDVAWSDLKHPSPHWWT